MKKNRHGKIRIKKLALFILMALCALVILIFGIGKGVSYLLGKVDTGNSPISYYLLIGTDKEAAQYQAGPPGKEESAYPYHLLRRGSRGNKECRGKPASPAD